MMRSGCSDWASSRASCPSRAVRRLKPALRSLSETTWRMWVSSSASRIFFTPFALCPLLLAVSVPLFFTALREFQLEAETAALADVAFDEDAAVVDAFDDLLDQGEPQSGALGHAVVGLGPVELIEHEGEVLWWNPYPGVGYAGYDDL